MVQNQEEAKLAPRGLVGSLKLLWNIKHLIPVVVLTTIRYYTSAYHETWTLRTALVVAVGLHSASLQREERRAREDKSIDLVAETVAGRKQLKFLEQACPQDGVLFEVGWKVKKRRLKGVLKEVDAEETGDREVQGEWQAHDSIDLKTPSSSGKVLLYLHGGAYCRLSRKTHRNLTFALSKGLQRSVLSVDYRLSPEVKFPCALHDAVSAYFYLTEDLKIPVKNIVVSGDSAGANLALALILYLRDTSLLQLSGGILFSPWIDLTASTSSWDINKSTDYLSMDRSDPMFPPTLFLSGSNPEDIAHPYVSPAISGDLSNLPPLLVQAGGGETLRDESALFAQRADRAGNDIVHEVYSGGVHVFVAVMEDGIGKKGIENVVRWEEGRFETKGRVASEGWKDVRGTLQNERDRKIGAAAGRKSIGDTRARELFTFVETVEYAAPIRLRKDSHPAAVKAVEENAKHQPRKGLTKVIRARRT
ncbi:hypothetical protein JCM5353_005251 [Sporobolomyces roseus]